MELHEKEDLTDITPKISDRLVTQLPPISQWNKKYFEDDVSLLLNISLKNCQSHHQVLPSYEVVDLVINNTLKQRHSLFCPECVAEGKIKSRMFMFTQEGMIEYWNTLNAF